MDSAGTKPGNQSQIGSDGQATGHQSPLSEMEKLSLDRLISADQLCETDNDDDPRGLNENAGANKPCFDGGDSPDVLNENGRTFTQNSGTETSPSEIDVEECAGTSAVERSRTQRPVGDIENHSTARPAHSEASVARTPVSPDVATESTTSQAAEDGTNSETSPDASKQLFHWKLIGSEPQNGMVKPELVFNEVELAKEVANKKYIPRGATKKLLESHFIYVIRKPPVHHKDSKFVCRVCELHYDTLPAVQRHVVDKRHVANRRRVEEMTALSQLPTPTAAQYGSLTALVAGLYAERGLIPERLHTRRLAAEDLRNVVIPALRQQFPESAIAYTLELFGSARTGVGFEESAIDLALTSHGAAQVAAAELVSLVPIFEESDLFTDVEHDFTCWMPHVQCVHVASGHRCRVAIGAEHDVQMAALIQAYCLCDERVAPLATALRYLAQVCEMDRPLAGSLPPSAFLVMIVFFLQQHPQPVLPVLHELSEHPDSELTTAEAVALASDWSTENTCTLGTLWLQLLQFYYVLFTSTDTVVSIRQRQNVSRLDKGWGNKKVLIEDPLQPRRSISRSISSSVIADIILDRLCAAALLFGVPRTADGPAICLASGETSAAEDAREMALKLEGFTQEELVYSFDKQLLCGQTTMPLICSVCQKPSHVVEDCPTLAVPPPEPLPPVSEADEATLDQLCRTVFNDWAPPHEEYVIRQQMVDGIERHIRTAHGGFPTARLRLFGSSCNGFGFRNSDLDICMTFDDCSNPQTLDQPEIIKKLARILGRLRVLHSILPITTAKVPIVKFVHRHSRLEGDISLYNTLAMHNTLLLHTYAKLDSRARILGYMVKLMAKICDICDASRGSLSSYAFTLMMIYYLQRCEPPVLPVLQELESGQRQARQVDDCDVSFFSDLTRLRSVWPQHGRNTQSAGALWVGFLHFYCETFDFDRHVVCVRRSRVLTKFEKLWNGANIAVEDPFLLSHNLGAGVRRKMVAFIRRTLQNWRRHHCVSPDPPPNRYRDLRAYLMSVDFLCEGPPPNSGGCHMCGRIGHWANDCPRRKPRPTPNKEEMRRDQQQTPAKKNGQLPEPKPSAAPSGQKNRRDSDRSSAAADAVAKTPQPASDPQPPPQRQPAAAAATTADAALQAAMAQLRPAVVPSRPTAAPAQPEATARLLSMLNGAGGGPPAPPADAGRRVHGMRRAESLERQMSADPPGAAPLPTPADQPAPSAPRPPPGFHPNSVHAPQPMAQQQLGLMQLLAQQQALCQQQALSPQQAGLAYALSQQANLTQSLLSQLQLAAGPPVLHAHPAAALQHAQLLQLQQQQLQLPQLASTAVGDTAPTPLPKPDHPAPSQL